MGSDANALRWNGGTGHYEVYYLSLTDGDSGVGAWIRYTMLAPIEGPASCALWFMAMEPGGAVRGHKLTLPIEHLRAATAPFALQIGDASLDDRGMRGGFEDIAWDLRWSPRLPPYKHVHPLLERARIAKTVLTLPHPDLEVEGTLQIGARQIELHGARGGQAHLWGSKHAARWAWAHCNDFRDADDEPVRDSFIDAVSVFVPRFGRELGPSTPLVARLLGEDFISTAPRALLRTPSHFDVNGWRLQASAGSRRIDVEVEAPRDSLVGVTYHDPDGEHAYCYNSEIATMRVSVHDRAARRSGWIERQRLIAPGCAHFEYAQRRAVPGLSLSVT